MSNETHVDLEALRRELEELIERDRRSLVVEWRFRFQRVQMSDRSVEIYDSWRVMREQGFQLRSVRPRWSTMHRPSVEASLLCWASSTACMADLVGFAFNVSADRVQVLSPRCWECHAPTWQRCHQCRVAFYCSAECAQQGARTHARWCTRAPESIQNPQCPTSEAAPNKHACAV